MIIWVSNKIKSWKLGIIFFYIKSLQGTEPYASSGTQTFFKRKVNKCLQIDCDPPANLNEVKIKD